MKIKISKSQWEEMGKKAGWMGKINSISDNAQLWWSNLSINEMKALTRKYYPDPHITWTFINQTPSFIKDIYQKENDVAQKYPENL